MKKALITGITGQDGAYLAEFLLRKGYIVHGIKRRASLFNTERIDHLFQDPHVENQQFFLHNGDLTDSTIIISIIQQIQPDEIYNLGAQSHVQVSFQTPEYTSNVDALGTLRILEAVRLLKMEEKCRIYQASTSEMYGKVKEIPQNETTPFYPRSPYGVAKLYSFWITVNYREAYNMYCCNGILFNHESPVRGETFVTRKITRAAARIALGLQDKFYLGNLDSQRDWGHAKDYVEAMYLMLQQNEPKDYVIATGITTKVRDFVLKTFSELGIEVEFTGEGRKEKGFVKDCTHKDFKLWKGKCILEIDTNYYRPTEVGLLIGDASKANRELNWKPKYTLEELIKEMVWSDIELMKKDLYLKRNGFKIKNYFE